MRADAAVMIIGGTVERFPFYFTVSPTKLGSVTD
jgi:hypothetical protein